MREAPSHVGVLAWMYFVVLWMTWTPVRDSPPEILWLPELSSWPVVLGNLLLFVPFGFVLAVGLASGRAHEVGAGARRGVVLRAVLAIAALSLLVELGQLRVPGRHVSPYDLAMNTGGAGGAAWIGLRMLRAGWSPRALIGVAGGAVLVGVVIFVSATGFAGSRMLELAHWDPDYEVLAGDEVGGERPYLGEVSAARICTGRPGDETCVTPGADAGARRRLVGGVRSSQQIRLSGVVSSRQSQSNHARIVTFSRDAGYRNATLAQEGRALVLRVRTPRSGPNGAGLEFSLPDAVPDDVRVQVSASAEPGRVVLTAEHAGGVARADFPWGYFTGWWLVRPMRGGPLEPPVLLRAALVAAAAFSVPIGLGAVMFGPGPSILRLLAGGVTPALLVVLLGAALQVPTPIRESAFALGFGLLGAGLGRIGLGPGGPRLPSRGTPPAPSPPSGAPAESSGSRREGDREPRAPG